MQMHSICQQQVDRNAWLSKGVFLKLNYLFKLNYYQVIVKQSTDLDNIVNNIVILYVGGIKTNYLELFINFYEITLKRKFALKK